LDGSVADQEAGPAGEGEGPTPRLDLGLYEGPLERLLALARARQIDLAGISLPDLVDQLATALQCAPPQTPLGQKGDWVVMACWLLQLRSLLLLPADTAAHQAAQGEADQLRDRLVGLEEMQAFAGWLDRRPQLGLDVFSRGQPELSGSPIGGEAEIDGIEFLWASLALFDDDLAGADTTAAYLPPWLDLHSVPEARERILLRLAEAPDGHGLGDLLPQAPDQAEVGTRSWLRRRSGWTSTFLASLELARQGEVRLVQNDPFASIQVNRALGPAIALEDGMLAGG
jgi:segregation and condensation protein A